VTLSNTNVWPNIECLRATVGSIYGYRCAGIQSSQRFVFLTQLQLAVKIVLSYQLPVDVIYFPNCTIHVDSRTFSHISRTIKRHNPYGALKRALGYLNITVHFCFPKERTVSNRLLSCTAVE
jgi:hypothetical protein